MSATVTSPKVVVVLREKILAHSRFYKFPSVLWEGTTASFFKALDSFISFFSFTDFFSLMNVNIF